MALKLLDFEPDAVMKTKLQLPSVATSMYGAIHGHYINFRSWIWSNPRGLTPQQVFDLVGTDEPLVIGEAVATMLNTVAGGTKTVEPFVPSEYAVKVNEDKTVTVNQVK